MISDRNNGNATYSANVKLHLYADDERVELGQLGPGFAILRNMQNINATNGEIESIVDQQVSRWKIKFTSPITTESRRFTFEPV